MRDTEAADPLEAFAREKGVTYVKLDGDVGDPRQRRRPLDVDGRRRRRRRRPARELLRPRRRRPAQGVVDALEVITRDPQVRSIFFNIFGGITRCDEVARGILEALDRLEIGAADRRAPRRHERRGGPADPGRRRRAEPPVEPTMLDAAPSAPWSWRAVTRRLERARRGATATSAAHSEGADLDLARRVVRAGARRDGARRRDRRRPRRAAAARGGAARS